MLIAIVALLVAMLLTEKDYWLAPAMEVLLILYVSFTGWSMFERERQEGAMEYLLSLPISRGRLFMLKWLPRLTAVIVVMIGYHFIHQHFAMHFLVPYYNFLLFSLTVFLLSVALSASMKSFLGTLFITLFLAVGLFSFIKILDHSLKESSVALQAGLTLLAFPVLFFIMFHKFDIKPITYFNKKYIPVVVLLVLLIFGITFVTTHSQWRSFSMTEDGSLYTVYSKRTVVSRTDQEKIILQGQVIPLIEHDSKIYAVKKNNRNESQQLVRLEKGTAEATVIYPGEPDWWFHQVSTLRVTIGDRFYLLLTKGKHSAYRILEVRGGNTRIIPVKAQLEPGEAFHQLAGGCDDPLQLLVFTDFGKELEGGRILRIFENGKVESLASADAMATWKNRLLAFNESGMTLYEIGEKLKIISQRPGEFRKIRRRFWNDIQKKVLVRIDSTFQVFDMEDETLELVNINRFPYNYHISPEGGLRLVWVDGNEISVSQFRSGHLQTEKIWFSEIEGQKFIQVFSSGLVVRSSKKWEIYRFEDDESGGDNYDNK